MFQLPKNLEDEYAEDVNIADNLDEEGSLTGRHSDDDFEPDDDLSRMMILSWMMILSRMIILSLMKQWTLGQTLMRHLASVLLISLISQGRRHQTHHRLRQR
jgi:hypothetical protein